MRNVATSGLAGDRSGIAMVEFALALPILLLLGLGGIETANYIMTAHRLSQIAITVADNAGRVRTAIDEQDVNELMLGGRLIGQGIDFAGRGRIILSNLEARTTAPANSRQWIRWQRCRGALRVTSGYGVPLDRNNSEVVDLDNRTNADHGAVDTASTMTGMGPAGKQIAALPGTAVMFAEIVFDYKPITPISFLGSKRMSAIAAFNVRERSDYSLQNGVGLRAADRSDCRLFFDARP